MTNREKAEELLLDYHLDQLMDDQQAWLLQELGKDAELRTKNERLGQILQPLDAWSALPVPAALSDRIVRSIKEAEVDPETATTSTIGMNKVLPARSASLRDILAIAACLLLLLSVVVPGIGEIRARSRMTRCADNLSQIFEASGSYLQECDSLSYAGGDPMAKWLPGGSAKVAFASNSRHIFGLLRSGFLNSAQPFVCPSSDGVPMRDVDYQNCDDFDRAGAISYATYNLSGPSPNLRPPTPIAYVSDLNPLFAKGRFDDSIDPDTAMSPAHGRRGQTVLVLDGHAELIHSPLYGQQRDNIWLAGNTRYYNGTETPTSLSDAFLVPGFPMPSTSGKKQIGN